MFSSDRPRPVMNTAIQVILNGYYMAMDPQ
jgi:hypothetical protein